MHRESLSLAWIPFPKQIFLINFNIGKPLHNKNQKVESSIPRSWSSNAEFKTRLIHINEDLILIMKQFFKSFQRLKLIVSYGEITLIVRFQDLINQRRPLMTLFCPSGIFTHLGIKTLFLSPRKLVSTKTFLLTLPSYLFSGTRHIKGSEKIFRL